MPEPSDVESFLDQAEEREKAYDWLGAAELYGKALGLVPETDFLKFGQIQEKIGYAFYRAAMQAESQEDFKIRAHQSVADYEEARKFYGRAAEPGQAAKMLRCDAVIACAGYWLASEVPDKKRLINECWRLAKECLGAFEKVGDAREYVKTFNQLSISIDLGFFLEWEFQARETMIKEALERGDLAIKLLSTSGNPFELATAYMRTATFLEVFGYYFSDIDKSGEYSQKAKDYVQRARKLSEEAFMIGLSSVLFGQGPGGFWGDGSDAAISNLEKTLVHVMKTRDRFIIGCTLDQLGYHNGWRCWAIEDPDQSREIREKARQFVEDAKRQYHPISFISPLGTGLWVEGPSPQYYMRSAVLETDLDRRRGFLEKAIEAAPEKLKRAESSGYPEIVYVLHWVFGDVLTFLAEIVANSEEKRALLEKALVHLNESGRICEQIEPLSGWNVNLLRTERADTKSNLADLAKDNETRRAMLQEAVVDKETSLKLCIKTAIDSEKQGSVALFSKVGVEQSRLGDLWIRLHRVSQNNEHLQRAIKAFADGTESFEKLGLKSRVAECFWKAARVYDDLGNHLKAAENFEAASANYKVATEEVPKLKGFYVDHAIYLQAWNEIEKARYHHVRQEYGLAKQHFEKVAELHRSLKQWSYLEPNYSAWARVENAEELSRNEKGEDAIKAFEEALNLFSEAKKSLQAQLSKIEEADEKQMANSLIKASDIRQEYCDGRIALEKAKVLDRTGDHLASSEKYGSAAEVFERISQTLESEQERREFRSLVSLSRAWQKMMLGDARTSPESYSEASILFEQASKESNSEVANFLALGHSRFCKALETGTRFADTGDTTLQTVAMKNLEIAAKYYVKAGFQSASEYAKATGLLFDAYVHMDNAKEEKDPEKRTKLYLVAEKVLQTSANSFMKAEHPEKREQVLRLLEKVREEKELAISIAEVLHTSPIVSTTTSFAAPTPTSEEAVGSERFEHADIQANLIIRERELRVGENLDLEIELVNAGKGPALLTKITEIIPQGFELTEKPEKYRVEDSYINMKGRRLDPLKTEEVRLVLKSKAQGTFPLKPRILYLDEGGKYKTHELESATITVKELGIKGWLKGER